jgi:hypothetical protein
MNLAIFVCVRNKNKIQLLSLNKEFSDTSLPPSYQPTSQLINQKFENISHQANRKKSSLFKAPLSSTQEQQHSNLPTKTT